MYEWQKKTKTRRISSQYAYKTDIILSFANGVRVAERVVQRKVTNQRRCVLGIDDAVIYPIVRTQSTETTVGLASIDFMQLTKITTRIVLPSKILRTINENSYYCGVSEDEDEDDNDKRPTQQLTAAYPRIRKSVNEDRTDHGTKYTLECEIEYEPDTNYATVLMHEDTLMDIMSDYKSKLVPDLLSLQKIFSCVVPKVQMWNCFDDNQTFLWAYKWNGIKAKFMCIGENAYIWPDAGEIYTDTCTVLDKTSGAGDNPLTLIRNMCMQVELMPDSIIIVEVVAISYFDTVHNPEPLINVRILNFLRSILYTRAGTPRITIGEKHLKVQTFHRGQLPKTYDTSCYDGLIIVQNDLLIKWKCPTIDMRYVGPGNRFSVAEKFITLPDSSFILDEGTDTKNDNRFSVAEKFITLPDSSFILDEDTDTKNNTSRIEPQLNAIYEVASNLKILRLRTDRRAASTEHEYRVFEKSLKLLNKSIIVDK
ncbi:uncharacterized protein LOC120356207 [Nilaparvata lugens]|uniref:uncharacterized protein LOC120356207 n=1 Tax=Nilaparvata lugens TaxID=108931 RepID=UPI00193D092F|nr:uncharacterized protein LOC120356207 [Nilaparvata lugens]